MALDNYANLKLTVIGQSHRGDLDLKIDDFILLAETEMKANPDEPLNIRENELIATGVTVVDSALVALPTRYQKARSLRITIGTTKQRIHYETPAVMARRSGSGQPARYTIIGENIQFDINADAVYTITFEYEADLTPLTSSNTTNNVLTNYPNIYLYGCLKHAMVYALDVETGLMYDALFKEAIESANTAESRARFGDSPTRAVGWAP
jgi:hypothetical protein